MLATLLPSTAGLLFPGILLTQLVFYSHDVLRLSSHVTKCEHSLPSLFVAYCRRRLSAPSSPRSRRSSTADLSLDKSDDSDGWEGPQATGNALASVHTVPAPVAQAPAALVASTDDGQ